MLDVRRGRGGSGLESAWPAKFGDAGVWSIVHRPKIHCPIELRAHPPALSAVLGVLLVSGSEDGLVLWLCVAQPCTFSCILQPSVASLQSPSLFGR